MITVPDFDDTILPLLLKVRIVRRVQSSGNRGDLVSGVSSASQADVV